MGCRRLLLDEVAAVCKGLVEGLANVSNLVVRAHGFASGCLDVRRESIDGVEHYLRGGKYAEGFDKIVDEIVTVLNISKHLC